MEQSEVLRRVIGILTQTNEWRRMLTVDVDRTDVDAEAENGVITALMNEMMPTLTFPPGTSLADAADVIGKELGQAVQQVINAFSFVFVQLADVHDSGRTEVSSDDVLRDLSLRADSFFEGQE